MRVDTYNAATAAQERHISVHLVSVQNDENAMLYYLETTEDVALTTIPAPCGSVDEAIAEAQNVASKYNINLILLDDNRTGAV